MASTDRGTANTVLSSDWTGLSKHLIATFYPVRRVEGKDSNVWEPVPNAVEVRAPLTDGSLEQTANWNSPFENQSADSKISTFSSLLQSDGFRNLMSSVGAWFGGSSVIGDATASTAKTLSSLAGKTAVTKLNSMQIFSGMPPLKISVTAHFRATSNAKAEVQAPLSQLMEWTMPKKLSNQGLIGNVIDKDKPLGWETLYPSDAPQIIAMKFADRLFIPIVIESMSHPLTGPRGSDGVMISAQTTLSLATLTALDAKDWQGTYK